MLFIVAYDIPNDGTRTLVADELKNWGRRVQYSVFECDLSDKHARQMEKALKKLISGCDSIRIYRVCQACRHRSVTVGGIPLVMDSDFYQV
jgi:CRISPR-associated protein Cas2